MSRGSDGIISLTFGDLERSDQGHLVKKRVSVRERYNYYRTPIGSHRSRIGWHNQFDLW